LPARKKWNRPKKEQHFQCRHAICGLVLHHKHQFTPASNWRDAMTSLLELTERGLFCPPGDFYIDPWQPAHRAVITHAHGNHARWGSELYLTASDGIEVLRTRLGDDANIEGRAYGEPETHNGVKKFGLHTVTLRSLRAGWARNERSSAGYAISRRNGRHKR
jgi:hypothetical protein